MPARTLADAAKSLSHSDTITLALASGGVGEGIIGFTGSTNGRASRATTRLLDATFPAYRSLLPNEWSSSADITVAPLVEAVRRVALVADRNTPVRLEFAEGSLALSAGAEDEGRAEENLEVDYDGEPITTAFNPQFLLDGLGALTASTARLLFTSANKPVVLRPDADGGELHLRDDARAPAGLMPGCWSCTMYVRHLTVSDFRSWHAADLALEPGPSVLVGPNGQGKTNLIEALGYVATLGSHRVSTDAPLVRAGAERALVRCAVDLAGPRAAGRDRDLAGPGQPGPAQRRPAAARRATCSACCAGCCSRRRTSPSSAATPASAGASSTSWSSPARRGWPACAPTTSGCSSSARRC